MPRTSFRVLAVLLLASIANADPGPPQGTLVNLLRRPDLTVITDAHPRFSWIVNDPDRGAVQSAYEILLTTPDNAPLWNSGKVMSAESIAVPYAGPPLQSDHAYTWSVRTWDAHDKPSAYSPAQTFNIGSLISTRAQPGEAKWVQFTGTDNAKHWVIENQHPLDYHPLPPTSVTTVTPDTYFIDFGKAAFATLRLTLTSPDDDQSVQVHLGEKCTPDHHVDRKPGGSIYYGLHTLKLQKGTHTYDLALPRHVSKMPHSLVLPAHMPEVEPYRYAEIVGAPSPIKPDDARQLALFYQFDDDAASFTSSDPDLNSVWEISKYTLKATPFIGTYTDGVRERMPYEADALVQSLGHYCLDREYAIARHSGEFLQYHATWPTEWVLDSVLIAHADYLNTGDADSLARNYDAIKAKLLLPLAREDGLISTRTGKQTPALMKAIHYDGKALKDITDWPLPTETDGFVFADYNAVVNAYHYRALVLMADIAAATDHPDDAAQFRDRAAKVNDAFNRTFLNPTTGLYTDGESVPHSSLHANAIPLAFGLVPPDRIPGIVTFLQSRHMACGPYGAQFLLDALYDARAADAGFSLLTNTTDRGWLNMIRAGSTMTTESWDFKYKKNLTWNHAWGAAPANLIPRKLMGVGPLEPGFKRLRIRPQPGPLTQATLKLPTIRGTVLVDYHRADDKLTLDVTIPANTVAEIEVPTSDPKSIHESDPALRPLHDAVFEVGGGTYHFTASPTTIPVHISVDAAHPTGPLKPIWCFFGADEPNYAYLPDGKALLSDLGSLKPDQVFFRTHNLLTTGDGTPALKWGSTNAYTEDAAGHPIYDWTLVDRIFDTYRGNHIHPYVQLGFMPQALSTHPTPYQHHWTPHAKYNDIYTGWAYPPADYAKWSALIEAWAKHSLQKYGPDELAQWYWEVWNEPNIGYWQGTPDEFFKLHDASVAAIRKILPAAKVGGPDSAGGGTPFLQSFLQHCRDAHTPLDFISFHAKGSPKFVDDHVRMGLASQLRNADSAFAIISSFPDYKDKPIVIGESDPDGCAACQGPQLGYRNGTMYSSYTAASIPRLLDLADQHHVNLEGSLTWAFEFEDQPAFAGFRVLATRNNIPLPVLNTFRLLSKMSGNRLPVTSDHATPLPTLLKEGVRTTPDISAFAAANDHQIAILLWHYHNDDLPGPDAQISLTLTNLPPGNLTAQQFLIDATHANPLPIWQSMGSPAIPTAAQVTTLKEAASLHPLSDPQPHPVTDHHLTLSLTLPRQAVSLLILTLP